MPRRGRLAGLTFLALLFVVSTGCSRSYWRRNADAEAYGLIREKAQLDARWAPPRSDIIPSPLSRLYDPADPDYGPLPPDDGVAHRYMRQMSDCDRIRGSHYWDEIGMGDTIENPAWVASLPIAGQPGPLLASAFKRRNITAGSTDEPLPFFERFAVTESLRSLKLPSIFDRPDSSGAVGRATLATADTSSGFRLRDEPRSAKSPRDASLPRANGTPPAMIASTGSADRAEASPKERQRKSSNEIQLVGFDDEDDFADPPPLPRGARADDRLEPDRLPELDRRSPRPIPRIGDDAPPAADTRRDGSADPDTELSDGPGDVGEVTGSPAGVDLSLANPALPAIENLTLEDAVRLSYLHGREYQFQLEQVYLAALDLAFDRFQFDVRFLGIGGGRPSSDLSYVGVPEGTQSLTATNRIGISRLLPAGGQWAVELANQTLWLFSDAPNESGTMSTLSFSFIQPLLFAAGRKVVLEDLTQSERNLLYALRELARFRQEFFVAVVAQGGYLGLLETIQQIANQEYNIERLREQLETQQADELRTDALSRTQIESRLLSQLNSLRNARRALEDRLDQYKIQLGLPPDLKVSIDRSLLEPFQLISNEMLDLEREMEEEFFAVWATIDTDEPRAEELRRAVAVLQRLADEIESVAIAEVQADFGRVEANLPRRLAALPEPVEENRRSIERNAADDADFFQYAREQYRVRQQQLERLSAAIDVAETREQRQAIYTELDMLQEDLLRIIRNLQGLQIGLRTELIELNPFDMPLNTAVGYALTNRVDLMNQRALVTDARRKVEVAANTLRAVLNVRVEGDISTPPILNNDNPLDFRRTNSTYRAGLSFVAPLDQIAQRNAYRVSQINYQRARRNYMEFEDSVKFAVRQNWRQLQVLRQNFEVTRLALRIAARQYDLAVEETANPEQQTGRAGLAGQNVINALDDVLGAQNNLIGIWVDYESARLNIYRDMGIMEIDARGLWVDPFYQNGLAQPDGDVDGPPGWPSDPRDDGGFDHQPDGPDVIPPAPAPTAGVQRKGAIPSESGPANPIAHRPASPADRGVLPAAHTVPSSPPTREAGHARTRQPPVPRRQPRRDDRNPADAATDQRPTGWRASAKGA